MGCYTSREFNDLIFLIGPPGSGKSRLKQNIDEQEFSYKYNVYKIPALELDNSIESREQSISDFQNYYNKKILNQKRKYCFLLCVKFERTDLMKKNLLSVIKYFRSFLSRIIVVVTNFDLSENADQDKISLKESLKIFLQNDPSRIVFSCKQQQDFQEIQNAVQKVIDNNQNIPLTLEGTIFEEIDESEQKQIMASFSKFYTSKD